MTSHPAGSFPAPSPRRAADSHEKIEIAKWSREQSSRQLGLSTSATTPVQFRCHKARRDNIIASAERKPFCRRSIGLDARHESSRDLRLRIVEILQLAGLPSRAPEGCYRLRSLVYLAKG